MATPTGTLAALRDALFAAAEAGDVTTLNALFETHCVRSVVNATELLIREGRREDGSEFTLSAFEPLWFVMHPVKFRFKHNDIFCVAVAAGHVEVVQWFFAAARIAFMRETLAYAWLAAVQCAMSPRRVEILEFLLEASADLFEDDARQLMLNKLINGSGTLDGGILEVLLAHGAEIHTREAHERCGRLQTSQLVDLFVVEGVDIVGAGMLGSCYYEEKLDVARRLLEHGADANTDSKQLHMAVQGAVVGLVSLYVNEGCVDVDARNARGQTALMVAVSMGRRELRWRSRNVSLVAHELINAGADLTLRDDDGWTPLHHAVRSEHTEVVKLLLQHGANANDVVLDGDFMREQMQLLGQDESYAESLQLLLQYGTSPHAKANDGVTLVQRLVECEAGKRFAKVHAKCFGRHAMGSYQINKSTRRA